MATYLVERYETAVPAEWRPAVELRGGEGTEAPVRFLMSTLIPGDQLSLSLFEAPSEAALANALAAGGLPFIRIVEAVVRPATSALPAAGHPVGEPA